MLIAHVSDSHFGTVTAPVEEALCRDLREQPYEVLVLTGDLTQRARRRQFEAAHDFLARLEPTPHVVVPGNHDIPLFDLVTRFTRPYAAFRSRIQPELETDWTGSLASITAVNSTSPRRRKDGLLTRSKIAAVASRIQAGRRPFRIVALHHPLLVTLPADAANRPAGADLALRTWTDSGADLFLSGHIHLPYCVSTRPWTGRRNAIVLNAGTGLSTRVRYGAPNSYNRIRLLRDEAGRTIRIERRDYEPAASRFRTHSVQFARDDGAGWVVANPDEPEPSANPETPDPPA